jgi:hypothetical protein
LTGALDYPRQIANLADRRTRMDAVKEQQFGSIKGAEAGQVPLVQQCFAYCPVRLGGNAPDSLIQIPVGAEQIRSEMPDNGIFRSGRNELDNREPVSDGIMITCREHGADFERRSAAPAPTPRVDLPGAVHLEVGMQREVVAEPEQLMLAARDHLTNGNAGQIGRRQGGHTEFGSGEHAAGKHVIQSLACPPDSISLGHGLIVSCYSTTPES